MKRLIIIRIIIILSIMGLFPLCFYYFYNCLIIIDDSDSFREALYYDVKFKYNLNHKETFDSLVRINSNIKAHGGGWKCYSQDKTFAMTFYFSNNDTILHLSSYEFNSDFRKRYNLRFPGNKRFIYGIDSNYEATKAVKHAFETEVLPLFASEFHTILPKPTYGSNYGWYKEIFYNELITRDETWWIKRDFDVIYLPIGTFILLCIAIPLLVIAFDNNTGKIRVLKTKMQKKDFDTSHIS